MKKQELLQQYPKKTFSDIFEEKHKAIKSLGTPEDGIQGKKQEFASFFEYDKYISKLVKILRNLPDDNIQDIVAKRIIFHFSQLNSLINWLSNLNFQNPADVNQVFQNFQQQIQEAKFLVGMSHNVDGKSIPTEKKLIDEYIEEVCRILKDIHKIKINSFELKKAKKIADNLIKNSDRYEEAKKVAENWIQAEGKAIGSSLKNKSEIFETKAIEHNHKNIWWWFGGGVISGIVAICFIFYFINKTGTDISIGASLLRISTLIIISYFLFYCMQQFSNQRKFYEVYKFKAIALTTMEELLKSYTERSDREKILNKAINIIFNEPSVKDDRNLQKKVLDEMIDTIKKKI